MLVFEGGSVFGYSMGRLVTLSVSADSGFFYRMTYCPSCRSGYNEGFSRLIHNFLSAV